MPQNDEQQTVAATAASTTAQHQSESAKQTTPASDSSTTSTVNKTSDSTSTTSTTGSSNADPAPSTSSPNTSLDSTDSSAITNHVASADAASSATDASALSASAISSKESGSSAGSAAASSSAGSAAASSSAGSAAASSSAGSAAASSSASSAAAISSASSSAGSGSSASSNAGSSASMPELIITPVTASKVDSESPAPSPLHEGISTMSANPLTSSSTLTLAKNALAADNDLNSSVATVSADIAKASAALADPNESLNGDLSDAASTVSADTADAADQTYQKDQAESSNISSENRESALSSHQGRNALGNDNPLRGGHPLASPSSPDATPHASAAAPNTASQAAPSAASQDASQDASSENSSDASSESSIEASARSSVNTKTGANVATGAQVAASATSHPIPTLVKTAAPSASQGANASSAANVGQGVSTNSAANTSTAARAAGSLSTTKINTTPVAKAAPNGANIMENASMMSTGTAIQGLENRQVIPPKTYPNTHISGMSPQELEMIKRINELNAKKRNRQAKAEAKFRAEIAMEQGRPISQDDAKLVAADREEASRKAAAAAVSAATAESAGADTEASLDKSKESGAFSAFSAADAQAVSEQLGAAQVAHTTYLAPSDIADRDNEQTSTIIYGSEARSARDRLRFDLAWHREQERREQAKQEQERQERLAQAAASGESMDLTHKISTGSTQIISSDPHVLERGQAIAHAKAARKAAEAAEAAAETDSATALSADSSANFAHAANYDADYNAGLYGDPSAYGAAFNDQESQGYQNGYDTRNSHDGYDGRNSQDRYATRSHARSGRAIRSGDNILKATLLRNDLSNLSAPDSAAAAHDELADNKDISLNQASLNKASLNQASLTEPTTYPGTYEQGQKVKQRTATAPGSDAVSGDESELAAPELAAPGLSEPGIIYGGRALPEDTNDSGLPPSIASSYLNGRRGSSNLDRADLGRADLSSADLGSADLDRANLDSTARAHAALDNSSLDSNNLGASDALVNEIDPSYYDGVASASSYLDSNYPASPIPYGEELGYSDSSNADNVNAAYGANDYAYPIYDNSDIPAMVTDHSAEEDDGPHYVIGPRPSAKRQDERNSANSDSSADDGPIYAGTYAEKLAQQQKQKQAQEQEKQLQLQAQEEQRSRRQRLAAAAAKVPRGALGNHGDNHADDELNAAPNAEPNYDYALEDHDEFASAQADFTKLANGTDPASRTNGRADASPNGHSDGRSGGRTAGHSSKQPSTRMGPAALANPSGLVDRLDDARTDNVSALTDQARRNAALSDTTLSKEELAAAELSRAKLGGAELSEAELSEATLTEEDSLRPNPAGMGDGVLSELKQANLQNQEPASDNSDNDEDYDGPHYVIGPRERVLPLVDNDSSDVPIYAVGVDRTNAEVEAKLQATRSRIQQNALGRTYGQEEPNHNEPSAHPEEDAAYEQALAAAARESIAAPHSETIRRGRLLAAQASKQGAAAAASAQNHASGAPGNAVNQAGALSARGQERSGKDNPSGENNASDSSHGPNSASTKARNFAEEGLTNGLANGMSNDLSNGLNNGLSNGLNHSAPLSLPDGAADDASATSNNLRRHNSSAPDYEEEQDARAPGDTPGALSRVSLRSHALGAEANGAKPGPAAALATGSHGSHHEHTEPAFALTPDELNAAPHSNGTMSPGGEGEQDLDLGPAEARAPLNARGSNGRNDMSLNGSSRNDMSLNGSSRNGSSRNGSSRNGNGRNGNGRNGMLRHNVGSRNAESEANATQGKSGKAKPHAVPEHHQDHVGLGIALFLFCRQLLASFFCHTSLSILAPRLSLRLGPACPSSMLLPFFVIGLIVGLISSIPIFTRFPDSGTISFLAYLLLTGLPAYRGIYRIFAFITRRRHDPVLLAASVVMPMIIFIWLSNTLNIVTDNFEETLALYSFTMMLSAATASTLSWHFPQDPIDSAGIMTNKGLVLVVLITILVSVLLLDPVVACSVLGVSFVMRLFFGYSLAKNQGTAQRPYIHALQLLTLLAILFDLILLKYQNIPLLSNHLQIGVVYIQNNLNINF